MLVEGNLSIREDEEPKVVASRITELIENSNFEANSVEKKTVENIKKISLSTVSKLYLRVPDLTSKVYLKAKNLVDIFEGNVKVVFFDNSKAEYVNYEKGIELTAYTQKELISLLGEDNVVTK